MTGLEVRSTDDAAAYLKAVGAFLTAHPIEHSVLLTTAHRHVSEPVGDALWLWVKRNGAVVAAGQHTPPHGAYVSLLPEEAATELARVLHGSRPDLHGVGGMRSSALAFGDAWTAITGGDVTAALERGVYVANAVEHPVGVDGRLRVADVPDVDQVQQWSEAFQAEIGGEHVPHVDERSRVLRGLCFLWEDGGRPVSMAAASPAYGRVVRVSLVYTPPERRRHGYAAACVAAVTARQLAQGNRCMLYTDLANPTSNRVYQRIGYRRIGDAVDLRFG